MKIYLTTAIGRGPTRLAAFDNALLRAGVANYNLVRLSSVIPPGSEVIPVAGPIPHVPGNWGDRLYVVMADNRIHTPNVEAWAGIGWVQDKKTGKGLLVEHESHSMATIEQDIDQSLQALMDGRHIDFGKKYNRIDGDICGSEPICALAIAVFQADSWDNEPLKNE